ncbi:MAG: hypothetical protein IKR69_03090 [Bacteroidales bacterium]|nr:hypothetical protein [Bacteroidales bacterium]
MRRILSLIAAILVTCAASGAGIRSNYRTSSGVTHILSDYVYIDKAAVPFHLATELVGFPDGSTAYLLHINYEEKTVRNVPKGVKMAVTLAGGKILRFEQMSSDDPTRRAFMNSKKERVYWNHTKYLVETKEMEKMVKGVKSIDVITGWDPDDYIQLSFPGDEFALTLKQQCSDIYTAAEKTEQLSGSLGNYSDGASSLMITAKPIPAKGARCSYNICLTYIYYKNSNSEDFDISFMIGSDSIWHVPYDAPVVITLGDGSSIKLQQTRDEDNFVYVYPKLDELRAIMEKGAISISIGVDGGTLEDSFAEGDPFGTSLRRQYQQIMSVVNL